MHTAACLDRFKAASEAGGGYLAEDSPFALGGYEIAALSAELVKRAVADVLRGTLAVVEELAGIRTEVVDPFLVMLKENQPAVDFVAFQRAWVEAQARG